MKKFNFNRHTTNSLNLLMLCIVGTVLSSCGGSGGAGNNYSVKEQPLSFGNTIQNVPLLPNVTTYGSIIVSNNTDSEIDDIQYENYITSSANQNESFVLESDSCKVLAAHSLCPLKFSVSGLDEKYNHGTVQVQARYQQHGLSSTAGILINYTLATESDLQLVANNYDHAASNRTIPVYIVNPESSDYIVSHVAVNDMALSPQELRSGLLLDTATSADGNTKLSANSVTELSLQLDTNKKDNKVDLTATAANGGQRNLSTMLNAITPVANGPIMVYTIPSYIQGNSSLTVQFSLYNAGNQNATITIGYGSGISNNTGVTTCTSGGTVNIHTGCVIGLNLTSNYSGSSNVTVTYNSTTLTIPITWYYSGGPVFSMTGNNLSPYATFHPVGGGNIGNITIGSSNNYPATITSIVGSPAKTGYGLAYATTASGTDLCTGYALNSASPSCVTGLFVAESGLMKLAINSKYYDASGTQQNYIGGSQVVNVYHGGIWSPWGNTQNVEKFYGASYPLGNYMPQPYAPSMMISQTNGQPYVLSEITESTGNNWRMVAYTYNGVTWTQVGQTLQIGGFTGEKIFQNPATGQIWMMLAATNGTVAPATQNSMYFESYNAITNTWTLFGAVLGTTFAAITIEKWPMDAIFDNAGNLYYAYSSSTAATTLIVNKLPAGSTSFASAVQIQSLNVTGYKINGQANGYQPMKFVLSGDGLPVLLFTKYNTTTPNSSQIMLESYSGSGTTWTNLGGGGAVFANGVLANTSDVAVQHNTNASSESICVSYTYNNSTATATQAGQLIVKCYSPVTQTASIIGASYFTNAYNNNPLAKCVYTSITFPYTDNANPYVVCGYNGAYVAGAPSNSYNYTGLIMTYDGSSWVPYGPIKSGYTMFTESPNASTAVDQILFGLNNVLFYKYVPIWVDYGSILYGLSSAAAVDIYHP